MYLSNQDKITAKFAVQVCGSKKSFAVAEVQEITAKVPQTSGFAVGDHPLLFCSCGIKCKFAVPSRGGILEDVLGHEDVLEDTFWNPWPWPQRSSSWPWPRSLQVLENTLSSAEDSHKRSQDFWLGEAKATNHMQWCHQKFSKKELFVR